METSQDNLDYSRFVKTFQDLVVCLGGDSGWPLCEIGGLERARVRVRVRAPDDG
jgi:hypothetical protein